MDKKSFEDNFFYEQFYWWFLGRRRIVRNFIRKYFKGTHTSLALDIGCGTGIILKDIEEYAIPIGIDPSEVAIEFTQKKGQKNLICGDGCNLPFKNESLDLITILGVLYHKGVRSDDTAIGESYRVLKKGGIIIIDEAAFNFLQSKHNYDVGSIRRYTRTQLINKCKKYNFEILKSSYWNVLMLPMFYLVIQLEKVFVKKQYSKLTRIPKIINVSLKMYLYMEAFLMKYIRFPFGPSVIIVCKKNGNA